MAPKYTSIPRGLLAPFRKRESRDDLATVVNDGEGIRLLKAWSRMSPLWLQPRRQRPAAADDLWTWVWEGVRFHVDDLAAAAGLDEEAAHELLRRVMFARLAYPDGTISKPATKLVADYVRARYPSLTRSGGRPRGSKDKAKRKSATKEHDEET